MTERRLPVRVAVLPPPRYCRRAPVGSSPRARHVPRGCCRGAEHFDL